MARYVDVDMFDDTVQTLNEQGWHITNIDYKRMDRVLFEMPTADVVKVVRCKDCVYWEQATDNSGNCNRALEITAYASDYCSYGKRREDDKERSDYEVGDAD